MKILSFGDLHLDSAFSGAKAPERAERRELLRSVFLNIMKLCSSNKCDLLLIAGDLFDTPEPAEETLRMVGKELSSLGIPVVISPGNHDPYRVVGIYDVIAGIANNVHVFKNEELEAIELESIGVTVEGYAFLSDELRKNPLDAPVNTSDKIKILNAHTDMVSGSEYAGFSCADIEKHGYVFASLGHVHSRSGRIESEKTVAVFSGVVQGRSIDEPRSGGVFLTEIEEGSVVFTEQIPVSLWDNCIYEIDVCGVSSDAELLRRIFAETEVNGVEKFDVIRIILVGEIGLEYEPNTDHLLSKLEGGFPDVSFSIKDKTETKIDGEALRSDPSLFGVLYRALFESERFVSTYDEDTRKRAFRLAVRALQGNDINPDNI